MDAWLKEQLKRQGIDDLTIVQTLAVNAGVAQRKSMVVCAPTSAGKTLIGEIAMLSGIHGGATALYLVSHKALAEQKYDEFSAKYGRLSKSPIARIAISTGDRDEGEADAQLVVATYEKALSLVIGGAINANNTVVVADELQILGEDKRGPEVELLCALLRSRKPAQFVALTATIENGEDLAGWLECELVKSSARDVDLVQEIWSPTTVYEVIYGQDTGTPKARTGGSSLNTTDVVDALLREKRGPVLVFVETRRDAIDLAAAFSQKRTKAPMSFNFAEQLELFSEGTEFSDRLKATAESKVAFHTADLTPSERRLVEQGLSTSNFDVCFATPTLAAGVNFPFRTVVFDRIRRRFVPPPLLPLSNYRNMSGRAGRLGMHDRGFAILVPRDEEERAYANLLVREENERLFSKLATMSMRKIALSLIASKVANTSHELQEFFKQTLFWYQVRERNPTRLDEVLAKLQAAIVWLEESGMLTSNEGQLGATELGVATSRAGLLPSSALHLSQLLLSNSDRLENEFEDCELALIHGACCCDEFDPDSGQRFLPQINPGTDSSEVMSLLSSSHLFVPTRSARRGANNAAVAVFLFASGEIEKRIGARTGIPSGQAHRFAGDIAWVLDGVHRLAAAKSLNCSQKVMNQIGILARRVRLGVPIAVVDVLRIAQASGVPGFGRQRAMALMKVKLTDRESVLKADPNYLEKVLASKERATKLVSALENVAPNDLGRARSDHIRIAESLGIGELVRSSYDALGSSYLSSVESILLEETDWKVQRTDSRDVDAALVVQLGTRTILIECKTASAKALSIGKEEAFTVLKRDVDIPDVHRLTVGKPGFNIAAESKACGSSEITLVSHASFIGANLLRREGAITSAVLFEWLCEPGVAELERLDLLSQRV